MMRIPFRKTSIVCMLLLLGGAGADIWLDPGHPRGTALAAPDYLEDAICFSAFGNHKLKKALFPKETHSSWKESQPVGRSTQNSMPNRECPNAAQRQANRPGPQNPKQGNKLAEDTVSNSLAFSQRGSSLNDLQKALPSQGNDTSPLGSIGEDDLLLDLVFDGFDRPGGVNAALPSLLVNSVLSQTPPLDLAENETSTNSTSEGSSGEEQYNDGSPILEGGNNEGENEGGDINNPAPDSSTGKQTGNTNTSDDNGENTPPSPPLPPLLPQDPTGPQNGPSDPVPLPGAFLLMATGLAGLRMLKRKI